MGIRKEVWVVFKTMHKDFQKGLKAVKSGLVSTQKRVDAMRKPLKRLGATFQLNKSGFQMWALGIMFFGMQVLRIFSRIAKQAFDSFNKVMGESLNTAREAMMGLSASTEMLKFSIGNAIATALEPMMPLILSIIDAISDWVEKHPKLTAGIVLLGIALGGIMFFFGQMVLFVSSLIIMWTMWGSAIAGAIGAAMTALAPFLGIILIIIGIIALLFVAWKMNWFGIRDILTKVIDVIKDVIGIWIDDIVKIFGLLWDLVKAIFTGDWGKIPEILGKIFESLLQLVFDIFFGIIKIVWAILKGIVNLFWNMLKALWDLLVRIGGKIVDWFKKWWGKGGIWGIVKGAMEGIVNLALGGFRIVMKIVKAAAEASNKLFGTEFDIDALNKLANYKVDFSGDEPKYDEQKKENVNITIQGNVIGEEKYIKKLGDTIAADMRRNGNATTVYG